MCWPRNPELIGIKISFLPSFLPKTMGNLQFFTPFLLKRRAEQAHAEDRKQFWGFSALFKGISFVLRKLTATSPASPPSCLTGLSRYWTRHLLKPSRSRSENPNWMQFFVSLESLGHFSVYQQYRGCYLSIFFSTNDPVAQDNPQTLMWAVSYFLLNCTN